MTNCAMQNAKAAKNDEFCTQYGDVAAEMSVCRDCNRGVFRDKTVLLPCDDPEWSSFTLFFERSFEDCGLRRSSPQAAPPTARR